MEKNLYLDFKPQDEISDTLSTGAISLSNVPCELTSPSTGSMEEEGVSKDKKIRKKRNAYQKIDDDVRLQLLESVQRGETLKSAAKRFHVNYSSAKSIFHIYRKEGRILKKATQEKGFGFDYPVGPGYEQQHQQGFHPHHSQFMPQPVQQRSYSPYQKPLFPQNMQMQQQMQPMQPIDLKPSMFQTLNDCSGSSSPLHGLADNFSSLLKLGNQGQMQHNNNQQPRIPKEEMMRSNKTHIPFQPSRFNPHSSPTHSFIKSQPNQNPQLNQMNQMNQMNQLSQMAQITFASKPPANGSPSMKQYDNFYMNYSNSPLSGNNGKMIKEGSESGSNRCQREWESFSEMISSMQPSNQLTDNLKKSEVQIPKLQVTPQAHQQSHLERLGSGMSEEGLDWSNNLEAAAVDTFKDLLNAQMVFSNALKKASYLNNLVQIQKNSGSPNSRLLSSFPSL